MQQDNNKDNSVDTDVAVLSDKAVQLYKEGRLQEAQDVCERILQKRERPDVVLILGMIAHEQRNFSVAVERYQQFLRLAPNNKKAHFNLGVVLAEQGHTERAIEHYEKSIDAAADNIAAHRKLGDAYSRLERWEDAIEAYQRVLANKADDVATIIKLGNIFFAAQQLTKTISLFGQALKILPDNARLHAHLGSAVQKMGETERAIEYFERALRLRPENLNARKELALVLRQLGRAEEALGHLEKVLNLQPDDVDAQINVSLTLRQLDQPEPAIKRLEQLLSARPTCGEAYYHISIMNPDPALIPVVQKVLSDPALANDDAIFCQFALGNLLNACKSFDRAFSHFLEGNALFRKTFTYDPSENTRLIGNLIKVYSRHFFEGKDEFGSASQLPVFIVGMPRSGTTLVEQILSSHPLVHGAGELGTMPAMNLGIAQRLKRANPRPEQMTLVDKKISQEYAARYLQELALHSTTAARITDKLPENFARIGLIKILFPSARIIHCKRNPVDNCVSLFIHCFMAFKASFELTELGKYYLQYQRLMTHWHDLFPGEILDVQYEELVTDQERISRQLVDYVGLDWDEKCMDFHASERPIMTPSNIQVRQPMYRCSIDRWKNYEKHLGPLLDVLREAH